MKWTEANIARAIALQTLVRKCVVLVDNCSWTGHECDVLGVTTDLRIIDVEVKISRADLKADAKKEKWWHRVFTGQYTPEQREYSPDGRLKAVWSSPIYDSTPQVWPRKVWKHYYAMPREIWKPELVEVLPSPASGILLLTEHNGRVQAWCERRAKPNKDAARLTPEQAIDIARLANLRMWEAYNQNDEAMGRAA